MRFEHMRIRTGDAYVGWCQRFVRFHGLEHPFEMGAREVEEFLSYLAVDRDLMAATQN